MTIAVMSDLHDNVVAWNCMVKLLQAQKINTLINCGDTCAPDMLKDMSKTFPGTIHTVFGNVADRELEQSIVPELKNVHHHGDRGDVELDGKRISFIHKPGLIKELAASGKYNLICHGHTHLKRWEKLGSTFVLNPGTAGGMFQYPSFATIELSSMSCKFHDIVL